MRVALLLEAGDPHDLAGVTARLPDDAAIDVTLVPAHAPVSAEPVELAVATGPRSARRLGELGTARHALITMDMEDRALPPSSPQAAEAQALYRRPLPTIVPARWMAEQLDELRGPGAAAARVVRPGVDRDAFAIPDAIAPGEEGAPLRIVVVGSDTAPGSGLAEAWSAASAMREPAVVTQLDPDTTAPGARASAYARADVVLTLPRLAALPLAPLEGFHAGATAVITPVTGHDEYVVDGVNALLAGWDDVRGTSRLLDLLARDRVLLRRLRTGALEAARAWPSLDEAARALGDALRDVAQQPPGVVPASPTAPATT